MSSINNAAKLAQLEALLFASSEPIKLGRIAELLAVNQADAERLVNEFQVGLDGMRGLTLITGAEGLELAIHPNQRDFITKAFSGQASPLSQSALEVVAILAYDGPKTKAEIDEIRGVASDATIRSLLARDIIIKNGKTKAPQATYELTNLAWRTLGLRSRDDLPPFQKGVSNAT